ncbi:MAG TPA: CDP-glucose 4,6-dehydratase [Flavobacteriales bacterium]|nr:CDP-glucose 4,6-dehydratase [Flavobacteriales bacterium]
MLKLLQETYRDKKVFLTGHTGFKGSWLAFILNHLGAQVKGYSLPPNQNQTLYELIKVSTYTDSVLADILDKKRLETELLNFQPDFVFHLAAQSLVIESYAEPALTYETNVMGTVNLLDSLRKYDKPCQVIAVTTDKVYENIEQRYAYNENDKLGGFDPYSSSKAACEIAVSSFRQSFFNPKKYDLHQKSVSSARSGNVIGGGDRSDNRIIPDLIRAIEKNESLEIRNPTSIRPWQHLLDPLSGYLLLGANMKKNPRNFAGAYNFGPTEDVDLSVEELVKRAHSIMGKGDYFTSELSNDRHEASLLHLDVTKAQNQLKWHPKLSADEAIRLTIEWYRESNSDPFSVTFKQIVEYFNM